MKKHSNLLEYFFFSNYFYGICAVALSIEATLQQRFPLNSVLYFLFVFFATVLYYTYPYIRRTSVQTNNPRTSWYTKHYLLTVLNQVIITIILLTALIVFANKYWQQLINMPAVHWLLILIFPIIAALYYGIAPLSKKYNLRKTGWPKPLIIGFTWAGVVNVYPILFYNIIHGQQYAFTLTGTLLFVKNLMFVTVLCIMFDVKDYSTDYVHKVNTFVVRVGLRNTIFYILLPLILLGLVAFIYYATDHQFHPMKLALNIIPFILLIAVAFSLRKRRSLMYYLIVIDGLMLIKAICGSVAMIYF